MALEKPKDEEFIHTPPQLKLLRQTKAISRENLNYWEAVIKTGYIEDESGQKFEVLVCDSNDNLHIRPIDGTKIAEIPINLIVQNFKPCDPPPPATADETADEIVDEVADDKEVAAA